MRLIKDHKEWTKRTNLVRAILMEIVVFFKRWIPNRFKHKIKNILLYRHVIMGRFNPIRLQKICFFYLPEVPDFGPDFTYIKLGKKENISNPNNYSVIFEADLPDNLSRYNEHFFDYSGLYALYKNNLIKEDYMLLIHYDTQILNKKWIEIIKARVRKNNVVFADWAIDNERSEISRWIYKRIDNVFINTHDESFLSLLKKNDICKIAQTSQFACSRKVFYRLMDFLMPLYEYVLHRKDLSFRYAHLMERAWGLFFAMEKYERVPVVKDSHNESKNYGENIIDIPILTTALEQNANSFSELLGEK